MTIAETDRFIAQERARTAEFSAECDRLIAGCRSLLEQADELLRELRAQTTRPVLPPTRGCSCDACQIRREEDELEKHGPLCFCVECLGKCDTPAPQTWKERQ